MLLVLFEVQLPQVNGLLAYKVTFCCYSAYLMLIKASRLFIFLSSNNNITKLLNAQF